MPFLVFMRSLIFSPASFLRNLDILADGMNSLGTNTMVAVREPSLGPVFGIKDRGSSQ